ncbi:hypothetical protein TcYC6_0063470 [Trypanosoma cruzi]|nr:hypothetical protein TcYC6_0063470 [Trypanosoma cruzi]
MPPMFPMMLCDRVVEEEREVRSVGQAIRPGHVEAVQGTGELNVRRHAEERIQIRLGDHQRECKEAEDANSNGNGNAGVQQAPDVAKNSDNGHDNRARCHKEAVENYPPVASRHLLVHLKDTAAAGRQRRYLVLLLSRHTRAHLV